MCSSVQIEKTAAQWLAKLDREDFSAAQQAGLTAWLDASIAHRVAFIRLQFAWGKMRCLRLLAAPLELGKVLPKGYWLNFPSAVNDELPVEEPPTDSDGTASLPAMPD
jgi:transmembrane sensor